MILKPRPFRKPNLGHPLARSLVGYWLMNEGSGNIVNDLSGNGKIGTFVGTNSWISGKFGPTILTGGASGNHIDCGLIDLGGKSFTVSMWVQFDVAQYTGYFAHQYGTGTDSYILAEFSDSNPRPRFVVITNDDTITADGPAASMPAGPWYHIVGTWDGGTGTATVYLNGQPVGTDTGTGTVQTAAVSQKIGGGTITFRCDNVALFDRALSASEIASLHADPFQMFDRPSIELWSAATLGGAPGISVPVLAHHHSQMAGAL